MSTYTTVLRARRGRSRKPAQAGGRTASALPPIVVRRGREDNPGCSAGLESELAPVIEIMDQVGLTVAGFRLAGRYETSINSDATITDRGTREKLLLAREAIREAARANGTFWSLPNPVLCYKGLVVELFGDGLPGTPWEFSAYKSGPVSLVAVQPAQS